MALSTLRPPESDRVPSAKRERWEDRFDRLESMTAQSGWDGPRSRAIPADAWATARELADAVRNEVAAIGLPFVSPGTDGSIGLRWSAPGRTLEVELAEDGVFFCETRGNAVVAEGPAEKHAVIGLVRALYR
jgi:hypothetical protein